MVHPLTFFDQYIVHKEFFIESMDASCCAHLKLVVSIRLIILDDKV